MATGTRIFWLVALCIFAAGCSGYYRVTTLPVASDVDRPTIKPGDMVRVTSLGGERIKGRFVSCDRTTLVIDEKDDFDALPKADESRRVLLLTEVQVIELYKPDSDAPVLVAIGAVVIAAVLVFSSIENSMDGMFSGQ